MCRQTQWIAFGVGIVLVMVASGWLVGSVGHKAQDPVVESVAAAPAVPAPAAPVGAATDVKVGVGSNVVMNVQTDGGVQVISIKSPDGTSRDMRLPSGVTLIINNGRVTAADNALQDTKLDRTVINQTRVVGNNGVAIEVRGTDGALVGNQLSDRPADATAGANNGRATVTRVVTRDGGNAGTVTITGDARQVPANGVREAAARTEAAVRLERLRAEEERLAAAAREAAARAGAQDRAAQPDRPAQLRTDRLVPPDQAPQPERPTRLERSAQPTAPGAGNP